MTFNETTTVRRLLSEPEVAKAIQPTRRFATRSCDVAYFFDGQQSKTLAEARDDLLKKPPNHSILVFKHVGRFLPDSLRLDLVRHVASDPSRARRMINSCYPLTDNEVAILSRAAFDHIFGDSDAQ